MKPAAAREVLRSRGLCGKVLGDQICILAQGHDGEQHEQRWRIETHVLPDPDARDARETISEHRVTDGVVVFLASTAVQAKWLCDILQDRDP